MFMYTTSKSDLKKTYDSLEYIVPLLYIDESYIIFQKLINFSYYFIYLIQ